MFRFLFLIFFCVAVQSTKYSAVQSNDDFGESLGEASTPTTEAAQNTTNPDPRSVPSEVPVQVQPTSDPPTTKYDPIKDDDEISGIQTFTVSDGNNMITGTR